MADVPTVNVSFTHEEEKTTGTVEVIYSLSSNGYEVWISLKSLYEVLKAHLREPCAFLSEAEAQKLVYWPTYPGDRLDQYDAIYSIGEFGSYLEKACKREEPLVIAEDPECYTPRLDPDQDAITFTVSRKHVCGYGNNADTWSAMVVNGCMRLELGSPPICAENFSECGFALAMSITGKNQPITALAEAIAQYLQGSELLDEPD